MQTVAAREKAEKQHEPVVPVMIAGNGVDERAGVAVRVKVGKSPIVGIAQALLIVFERSERVDLVPAHHEQAPASRRMAADHEFFARQQRGDGEGRIETVAEIGDIIDP